MGVAEIRLQDAFRKNAMTYADIDPVRHPDNAKQACNVLAQGVEEGLEM